MRVTILLKISVTLMIFLSVAIPSTAQTEKGRIFIGGSLSYVTDKQYTSAHASRTTSFSLSPKIAIFTFNDLSIGTALTFTSSKSYLDNTGLSEQGSSITTTNYLGISPLLRYYLSLGENFKFFGQANIYYALGKNTKAYSILPMENNTSNDFQQYGGAISPGFSYFATTRLGIEFFFSGLSYSETRNSSPSPDVPARTRSFTFGFSTFNPSVGINYHF